MNDSQAIFALLRGVLEKNIAGCECGGIGFTQRCLSETPECLTSARDCHDCLEQAPHNTDCPTCTPWREMVKELCWHEVVNEEKNEGISTCSCGYRQYDYYVGRHLGSYHGETSINPDLTTAMEGSRLLIVRILQDAGMWDGFLLHASNALSDMCWERDNIKLDFDQGTDVDAMLIEILTDGIYLVPAIRGHLEVV